MTDNVTYMFGDFEETEGVGSVDDTVNIPRGEYEDLLEQAEWLRALEAAGVDNWDGYDYAAEIYNKENEVV